MIQQLAAPTHSKWDGTNRKCSKAVAICVSHWLATIKNTQKTENSYNKASQKQTITI